MLLMVGEYTRMSHYKEKNFKAAIPACRSKRVKNLEHLNNFEQLNVNILAKALDFHLKETFVRIIIIHKHEEREQAYTDLI